MHYSHQKRNAYSVSNHHTTEDSFDHGADKQFKITQIKSPEDTLEDTPTSQVTIIEKKPTKSERLMMTSTQSRPPLLRKAKEVSHSHATFLARLKNMIGDRC